MPFSESLKLIIRKRAHFRCCICRTVGVEIHHIVPQEMSGEDSEDNAAPLCPSCHELYGANPTKRKFIREARDFWYELCERSQSASGLTLEQLQAALGNVASRNDVLELQTKVTEVLALLEHRVPPDNDSQLNPVPLERYIQLLYENDYGDREDHYEWFFDSRMWYDRGSDSYELLDLRAWFLKLYGEETARRVCLYAQDMIGFDSHGFTEEAFGDVLNVLRTTIILINLHEKHAEPGERFVRCARSPDGTFHWTASPNNRANNRGQTTV